MDAADLSRQGPSALNLLWRLPVRAPRAPPPAQRPSLPRPPPPLTTLDNRPLSRSPRTSRPCSRFLLDLTFQHGCPLRGSDPLWDHHWCKSHPFCYPDRRSSSYQMFGVTGAGLSIAKYYANDGKKARWNLDAWDRVCYLLLNLYSSVLIG